MVRNAGKFGKAKRGGGRHFSRDLSRLDADGKPQRGGGSDDSSDDDDSEEDSDDDDEQAGAEDPTLSRVGQLPPTAESDSEGEDDSGLVANLNSTLATTSLAPAQPAGVAARRGNIKTADEVAQARKEKRAAVQQKKSGGASAPRGLGNDSDEDSDGGIDLGNENQKATRSIKLGDLGAPKEMSRREREQAQKKAAAERYAKMHAAGKTDEAKSDLARLAEIRKQREQAAARRKAETDAAETARQAAVEKSGKKVGRK